MTTVYYGAVAEFENPQQIYKAAKKVTEAGYRKVDSHTPFPIHGMDAALKHGPSHVGWICAACGLTGILAAQALMYFTNGVDYQFVVAGKRPYDWPTTVPITFELMVLLSAFGAVIGMLAINKLPRFHHPIFEHSTFHRANEDRFFLSIEAADPKFNQQDTIEFLQRIGGRNVELVEDK